MLRSVSETGTKLTVVYFQGKGNELEWAVSEKAEPLGVVLLTSVHVLHRVTRAGNVSLCRKDLP